MDLHFCLFEDVTDCSGLRRTSFKRFASLGIFVSFMQKHEDKHYQPLNHRNLALSMQFTYEIHTLLYALLFATQH